MQSTQAGAVNAPRNINLSDVQAARDDLQAKLLAAISEFEDRYGCQVTNLWCDGSPRTTGVRATVQL